MFHKSPNVDLAQPLPTGERLGGGGRDTKGKARQGYKGGREGEKMDGDGRKNSRGEKDVVNMQEKEESHPPNEAALHNMVASRFHSQDGPHALQLPQQLLLGLAGSCSID